jgi:hypothetical protein
MLAYRHGKGRREGQADALAIKGDGQIPAIDGAASVPAHKYAVPKFYVPE